MFRSKPVPENRLIYIHIYKCGGTSMRRHIEEHLVDDSTQYIDHWAYMWEPDVQPLDRLLGNVMRSEELRFGPLRDPSGSVVVATHCFFYEWMKSLPDFRFATMLRDPISRVISQFDFEQRVFGRHEDQSIVDFIDGLSSYEFNLQTAALCGSPRFPIDEINLEQAKGNLHMFDFVGFVERFDESLGLFNRIFDIDSSAPAPVENAGPPGQPLPDWLTDRIRERARFDLELYDYARRLYRGKVAALEILDSNDREQPPPSLRR